MDKLSLYIHIPFCVRKCHYCDFLSASFENDKKSKYVDALCKEIRRWKPGISRSDNLIINPHHSIPDFRGETNDCSGYESENFKAVENEREILPFHSIGKKDGKYEADTIFFGGGTPSLLSENEINSIFEAIRDTFFLSSDIEITMEMNPKTVTAEKLDVYKKQGINRLSIGLQSADNIELKKLGRIHTWEDFQETWNLVREKGFKNVNIDLMSAIPGQTIESYKTTLRKVLDLSPEHISAYSLIIEEGTPFYEWFGEEGKRKGELPEEEEEREMYYLTYRMLREKGYERYEISNYAKEGYSCCHNEGYWTGKNYLGFGVGAASYLGNIRFKNESVVDTYIRKVNSGSDIITERYVLKVNEIMQEYMFLGLRRMEGVSKTGFLRKFNVSIEKVYGGKIEKLIDMGLLEERKKGEILVLTERGIDVSNTVFLEFI